MGIIEGTKVLKHWRGEYSFAVDGGAQGTITLRTSDGPLPSGAIVVGGLLDISSSCLSGSGTMALQVEGSADILAATAQAGLTAGRKDIIPDFTGSATLKLSAAKDAKLVIASAAFTAGAFVLHLFWL